nr:immunoglobulin light chain junction region [Macaca mulatta]
CMQSLEYPPFTF